MELPTLPTLPDIKGLIPDIPDFSKLNSPKIASSLFTAGVKQEVATADIYTAITGTTGQSPITSIQALDLMPDTSLFDKLNGSATMEFLDKAKKGIKFDASSLTDRITSATGDLKASFGVLTTGMKNDSLLSTFKDKAKYVLTTIKDTKSLVNAAKSGDIKALGNFINKFTGKDALSNVDKGALGGVLSSVVKASSDLGISGVFTSITDVVKDNGVLGKITRAALPIVVKNSDSRLFKEIASGGGGKLIDILSPGFSKDFSKAFKYNGTNTKSLSSFENVLGSFNKINANWDKSARGVAGNVATNLSVIANGSKDFQNLLSTGVSYWTKQQKENPSVVPPVPIESMHVLSTVFSATSVSSSIAKTFPKVALLNSYNKKLPTKDGLVKGTRTTQNSKPIDPRLISGALGALLS